MSDLLMAVIVVAAIALVMVGLTLLALWIRRRGKAGPAIGAAMAAYDEAMHSTAHDTFVEVQAQRDRTVPVTAKDRK
ncbi:hypothetical protein BH10ACT7_BH10ACT7_07360 [soil metagenome]